MLHAKVRHAKLESINDAKSNSLRLAAVAAHSSGRSSPQAFAADSRLNTSANRSKHSVTMAQRKACASCPSQFSVCKKVRWADQLVDSWEELVAVPGSGSGAPANGGRPVEGRGVAAGETKKIRWDDQHVESSLFGPAECQIMVGEMSKVLLTEFKFAMICAFKLAFGMGKLKIA